MTKNAPGMDVGFRRSTLDPRFGDCAFNSYRDAASAADVDDPRSAKKTTMKPRNNNKKKEIVTLIGRLSLLLVLLAWISGKGGRRGDVSSSSPTQEHALVDPSRMGDAAQDHRRIETSSSSSSSASSSIQSKLESIAEATASSSDRVISLQFSLGKVDAVAATTLSSSQEGGEDTAPEGTNAYGVPLFRAVEKVLLHTLCQEQESTTAASSSMVESNPTAIVSGGSLVDGAAGSLDNMCTHWAGRQRLLHGATSSQVEKRPQRRNLREARRHLDSTTNESSSIPVPDVYTLLNGTVNNSNSSSSSSQDLSSSDSSPYSSDFTVLQGHVKRWRLQEKVLKMGISSLTNDYYYTVWTVQFPVLQLGTYYWQHGIKSVDDDAEGGSSQQQKLAVYGYDDDYSNNFVDTTADDTPMDDTTADSNRTATVASRAVHRLQIELQRGVNVAIRTGDFDQLLGQRWASATYRASVVGMEPLTFGPLIASPPSTGNVSESWSEQQLVLAILYGLIGLIALTLILLVGWYACHRRAVWRRSKMAATVTSRRSAPHGHSKDDKHKDTTDGLSTTSGSSLADAANAFDDPGYCWIPLSNKVPGSGGATRISFAPSPSLLIHASSRGWVSSLSSDDASRCRDPLMVLMEPDDDDSSVGGYNDNEDDDIGDGCNVMDSLDEEASLASICSAVSATTVEVDVDTLQIVNSSSKRRVRFDRHCWVMEIPNRHGLMTQERHVVEADADTSSVSSLSDTGAMAVIGDPLEPPTALINMRRASAPEDQPMGSDPAVSVPEESSNAHSAPVMEDDTASPSQQPPCATETAPPVVMAPTMSTKAADPSKQSTATAAVTQGDVAAGGPDERQVASS